MDEALVFIFMLINARMQAQAELGAFLMDQKIMLL